MKPLPYDAKRSCWPLSARSVADKGESTLVTSRLKTGSLLAFATCLAAPSFAQNQHTAKPITGPIKDAGIYHHATDTWTRPGASSANFGTDVLYNNDANTGYFSTINDDWVYFEEGRIPGTGSEGNSACYEINCYQTAYCTNQANAITLEVSWHDGYEQCTDPTMGGAFFPNVGALVTTGPRAAYL